MSAFRATYSDWRLVRSRKVVQIVLEVPLEAADQAYAVLGGMPNPGSETWVGVARINPEHTNEEEPPASASSDVREAVQCQPASDVGRPARAKRWDEMLPAAQAGMLCNEVSFQKFLSHYGYATFDAESAAIAVRSFCGINSRRDLNSDNAHWPQLVKEYRHWMRAPGQVEDKEAAAIVKRITEKAYGG